MTITLASGDNVVCTFVNTQQGSVTIVKDSVPDGPTPFDFSVSPATVTPSSFTLDDDGTPTPFANSQVLGGIVTGTTYTVTETPAAGFTLTAINCVGGQTATDLANSQVAITFTAGDNVICTFVNTQQGTITVVKDSVPDGPTPFNFTASAPSTPTSFTLDDDGSPTPLPNSQTFTDVPAGGPYTITETPAAGFTLTAISCIGGQTVTDLANGQVAITFSAGDAVVCTFVNTQQGSITIVKDAVPDGPTPFSFTASAPLTPTSFTLDDDGGPTPFPNSQTFANVPAGGPFTITETPAAGFTLTAPVSCTGTSTVTPTTNGVSITLVPGDNVVCTFVNVDPSASAGGSSPSNPSDPTNPTGATGATGATRHHGTAFTGFDPSSPVSGGVAAVILGSLLVITTRRRRHMRQA